MTVDHDAKLYAAVLYAITDKQPDMPVADRAALADAILACLHERGLVDTLDIEAEERPLSREEIQAKIAEVRRKLAQRDA